MKQTGGETFYPLHQMSGGSSDMTEVHAACKKNSGKLCTDVEMEGPFGLGQRLDGYLL